MVSLHILFSIQLFSLSVIQKRKRNNNGNKARSNMLIFIADGKDIFS